MESRAAGPAVPRLGRAQRPGRPLRRQRRGPGSVRLAARRGHRGAGHAGGQWRWLCRGPWRWLCRGQAGRTTGREGQPRGPGRERSPGRSPAVVGGPAGTIPRGAPRRARHCRQRLAGRWLALRRPAPRRVPQARRLLRGGLRGRICGGPGFGDVIGLRLARARNHQARRHGPRGHEIFRIIPAEQACLLPIFLRRGTSITIPTRLVTLCIHHRPQSRHISGKCRSVPILTLSRPYGLARGSMLPTESERVQRAIFSGFSGLRGATPGQCHHLAGGWRFPGPG